MATISYNDSILSSIKKLMPGSSIPEEYTIFDDELILDINTELAILSQIGVGKLDSVFVITGTGELWSDFIDDPELLSLIPSYIAHRVKMVFDPPKSSIVMEQLKDKSKELEFRIMDGAWRHRRRQEGKS